MTLPAFAEPLGGRLPSIADRHVANQLRSVIAATATGDATLRVMEAGGRTPTEITLTPGMSELLMDMLRHIGSGHAVTFVPIGELLTTQQAADLLNVSRPHLISLLEREAIPHHRVGRHRRIRAQDIFAYKARRDAGRSDALDALAAEDADLL